jgi:hypothetical protein
MTNDLQLLLDRLMFLRLCGSVINAHIEHRMTFNDWFPKGPLDQHEYNDRSDENGRLTRLLEAGVCCAFDLCNGADDHATKIKAQVWQAAITFEHRFVSYYLLDDPNLPMVALAPLAVALERLSDEVMPPADLLAIYDEVKRIYALHGVADIASDQRARSEAEPMMAYLREAGFFTVIQKIEA